MKIRICIPNRLLNSSTKKPTTGDNSPEAVVIVLAEEITIPDRLGSHPKK